MATAARLAVAGRATAGVGAPAVAVCGATRRSLRVLADRLDLDVQLDHKRNAADEAVISADGSRVVVRVCLALAAEGSVASDQSSALCGK